jgi:hypothetical protein
MPLCKHPTQCPCPGLSLGYCRHATIATCIPSWINSTTSLNVTMKPFSYDLDLCYRTNSIKDIPTCLSTCFSIVCFATFSNLAAILSFHSFVYFLFASLIYFVASFYVAFYHIISKYSIIIKMCDLL